MPKVVKIFLFFLIIIIAAGAAFLFFGKAQVQKSLTLVDKLPAQKGIAPVVSAPVQTNITWGVDFSQFQAEYLKLDWKETYLAIINDLGVKNIKLHTNWKLVETGKDTYDFDDTDWQIQQAEQNNVNIIYVLGMKTGRWPECHIADWALGLSEKDQQSELLKYITAVVSRYQNSKVITYWQVENEPLFKFGECPSW